VVCLFEDDVFKGRCTGFSKRFDQGGVVEGRSRHDVSFSCDQQQFFLG